MIKEGCVVFVASGRFAGKKAIVMKHFDDGDTERPYSHALIVGIDKYPGKVYKKMEKKKKASQLDKLRPFLKLMNFNHLEPTSKIINMDFEKSMINKEDIKVASKKAKALALIKKELKDLCEKGKHKWFFNEG